MREILKKYFGYTDFQPLQEEIIKDVNNNQDVLVLMPTGSGKSLCYQLPAIMKDGITVVISPLISLMKDQVDDLQSLGIPAVSINSTIDYSTINKIKLQLIEKHIKLLYVAPERIMIPDFLDFLHQLKLSLIAIDESHCISEWGHDFRPEYRKLNLLKINFPTVPIIALTSTAVPQVQSDIITQLNLKISKIYKASLNRKNLFYEIKQKKQMYQHLLQYIKNHLNDSGIIYCQSRKSVENLATKLQEDGILALPYHAGLSSDVRSDNQDKFIKDDIRIIVATIAFGMGIDKPNVRYVIHCDMPKSIEGYYQETGRAGRDGIKSDCILFFSYGDKIKQEYFIKQIEDEKYRKIAEKKLWDMVNFCKTNQCRRITLLNYFGEKYNAQNCNMCDICVPSQKTAEIMYPIPEPIITKIDKATIISQKYDIKLFEILRTLRKKLADKEKMPPYIIFNDVSLREMASKYPQDLESFRKINGVGEIKLQKYGTIFIEKIRDYRKTNVPNQNLNFSDDLKESIREVVKSFPSELVPTDVARILTGHSKSKRAKKLNISQHPFFCQFSQFSIKEIRSVIYQMLKSNALEIIPQSELPGALRKLRIPIVSKYANSAEPKSYSLAEIQKEYSNAYEKWTDEEEKKLIDEYNNGKTIKELSKLLSRQPGGIRSRLKKSGLVK